MKQITITTEFIRLDALLKWAGETMTGGEAKQMILEGNILVNGEACTMRGKKLRNGDVITVNGSRLEVVQIEGNPGFD